MGVGLHATLWKRGVMGEDRRVALKMCAGCGVIIHTGRCRYNPRSKLSIAEHGGEKITSTP
jgi:hypothetical protein